MVLVKYDGEFSNRSKNINKGLKHFGDMNRHFCDKHCIVSVICVKSVNK